MRFSNILPALGAFTSLVEATPTFFGAGAGGGLAGSGEFGKGTSCSLANSWKDHVLFQGICAPETESSAAVSLGLNLPSAQITGDIGFSCESNFLTEPKIRVSLGGISAYVELDLSASAAVHQSVELFASPKLQIAVPGLESELGAAVALDLVVGCGAAIDLSAGVYISFADSAYVDISLLTKDVVGVSLDGLVTKALPIGVGADVDLGAGIDLQLGLRLRSELNIGAGVDIPILDIGADAGFGAAVWVSLFDYTATIAAGAGAGLSVTGDFACNLGLAVDGNLGLGGGLDFGLVPSLSVSLAKGAKATFTQKDRGTCGSFIGHFKGSGSIGGPTVSASGLLTASDLYTASAGASVVVSIPADVTASAHISGSLGGSLSLTLGLPDASASLELPHLSGSVDLPVISASVDISGSAGLPELSNSVNLPLESASAGLTLSGGLDIPDITISGGSDATAIFGSLPGDNGGHTDSVSATVSVPESAGSTTDSGSYPVKTGDHEHHDSPSKPADTSDADAVTATSDAVIATSDADAATSDAVTATSDAVITQTPDASGLITSTLRETHTYTITSCAASVINCPASYTQKIVTSTIIEKVTVCPATATATASNEGSDSGSGSGDDSGSGSSPVTTSAAEAKTTIDLATITKTLTTLKPCTKLTTSTFVRPTNPPPAAATITIVHGTAEKGTDETATKQPEPLSTLSRVLASATATDDNASPAEETSQPAGAQPPVPAGSGASYNPPSNATIPVGGATSTPTGVPVVAGAHMITSGGLFLMMPLALAFIL